MNLQNKLSELINEYNTVTEYKVNVKNQPYFYKPTTFMFQLTMRNFKNCKCHYNSINKWNTGDKLKTQMQDLHTKNHKYCWENWWRRK